MAADKTNQKYVYLFNDIDDALGRFDGDWEALRGLLGGKGANLFDATSLGIPVPPGLVKVPTCSTQPAWVFQCHPGLR